MGKLSPGEAQRLGLDGAPAGGRKLSPEQAADLGLDDAAPPPSGPEAFELPYPDRPMEGLALDAETRQPVGSVAGSVNPIRAASLGLSRGFMMEGNDELGAKIDSALPEWAGGKSEQDSLADTRNAMAANEAAYPGLTTTTKVAGGYFNPIFKAAGAVGSMATGLSGVGLRALAAMGLGAAAGGTQGAMSSDQPLDHPDTISRAKTGAVVGGVASGATQLAVGEPLRAAGGWVGNRIAASDQAISGAADDAIASAQGARAKQAQEAVGGGRNIRLEEMLENAPRAAPPPAPVAAAQTAPRAVHMGTVAPPAAVRAGSPGPAAQARAGVSSMDQLKQRGLDNARRAIDLEQNSPIPIPSRDEAVGAATAAANDVARQEARRGVQNIAVGAAVQAAGNPMGIGTYNLGRGVQRIVRAAFSAPAVLNRLRGIPGAGRSIEQAARKGSASLSATLYTLANNDPKVAQELQAIEGEMAPQNVQDERALEE